MTEQHPSTSDTKRTGVSVYVQQPGETTAGQLLRGFAFGCGAGVGLLVTAGLALHALGVELLPSRG